MITVTFEGADGSRITTKARPGTTLMEAARAASVPGILAECGGACSCSTCHVYVAPDFFDLLEPAGEMELDLLDFAWEPDPASSRLSCQIVLNEALEGLVARVPERQG
ncbi:2Fe-2S ferredoxin [Thioclava marina]|jgi:Ferredoxin|uniref:2Fe-2S ferredoxin n=1 Tax=Thioclava marina TaxID=1915077 RepID=A0ABX3MIQ3_9RHOB|nr:MULTISPECIES: 2Fe-2S iron-sulfur cluster-binding protein [Thioclava]MBD3803482.1 2Fe-2S iron-sulfur cluster binding domain-containing protein [Thioclava sp.]OOY11146.1 2Fe-2S ferredoxin [Thioclava marina]